MEEQQYSVHQLTEMIQEWGIQGRIEEKINIWGIRYSKHKIHSLPYSFLRQVFLYYILRFHPQLVSDYEQDVLAQANLALKKTYSVTHFDYFKANSHFDFAMVVVAKGLKYFLLSHFPRHSFGRNLEGNIYVGTIEAILGYGVDVSTYEVVLHKMKKEKERKKNESFLFDNLASTATNNQQMSLHNFMQSEKHIHRNGQFNPFRHSKVYKPIDSFKMELKEVLRVKKHVHSRKPTEQQQPNQPQSTDWHKTNYSMLNLKQLSAAMAIQDGFNKNSSITSTSIHLLQKRQLRKKIAPKDMKLKQEKRTKSVQDIIEGITKEKSWIHIVDNMRSFNKENQAQTSKKYPTIMPNYLNQKVRTDALTPIITPTKEKERTKEIVQFKAKNPHHSMEVSILPLDQEPMRQVTNKKRSNFMEQLSSFEKKCKARREFISRTQYPNFTFY